MEDKHIAATNLRFSMEGKYVTEYGVIFRIIDEEAGVVIYMHGEGMCCIPISQTKLAEKEDE